MLSWSELPSTPIRVRKTLTALMLSFIVLVMASTVPASPAHAETPGVLFTAPPMQADAASTMTPDDPAIVRSRLVSINFDTLAQADGPAVATFSTSDRLALNLFDEVLLIAVLDRVADRTAQGFTWIGHIEGVDHSQVTLVLKDGVMVGNVRLPDAFYQVRYTASGLHVIHEIDPQATLPHQEPIPVDLPKDAESLSHDALQADDGSVFDLLVGYTSNARSAAGGTASIKALIDLAVAETNTAYANSNINTRLRLVHTVEVLYAENGNMSTAINRLRLPADGYMDEIHTLRDTYKADLVSFLVEDGIFCGIGYLMSTPSHAFEAYAFNVTKLSCATGNYTFGHELGHNMGSAHDYNNSSTAGAYPYSYGYQAPDKAFRTVMAYNCSGKKGCPRILHFSNPDVHYDGQPTGSAESDNARSLNNTAAIVANWRVGGNNSGTPDISVAPSSFNFGSVRAHTSHMQTFSIANNGFAPLDLGSLALGGPHASEFNLKSDTCSGALLSSIASCNVTVVFAPRVPGSKTATLTIPSNDPDTPSLTVPLQGEGTTPLPSFTLDNFKCYQAKTAKGTEPFDAQEVALEEPFATKDTLVSKLDSFCNPVDVNGEGLVNPATNLTCYQIKDVEKEPVLKQEVAIENRFGTHTLLVSKPQTLCVPSAQDEMIPTPPLDAFKCYQAKTAKGTEPFESQEVTLEDAFETKGTLVLKPESFCSPVDVNGKGLVDPATHLTCYQIKDAERQPVNKQEVEIDNQFGAQTLSVLKPQSLCVPSAATPLN